MRLVPGTPHTPPSDSAGWLRARVAELEAENARLREVAAARDEAAAAQLAARDAQIVALAARVEELERRRGKDSSTSSKPPRRIARTSQGVLAARGSPETWAAGLLRVVTGRCCWRQVCCPSAWPAL